MRIQFLIFIILLVPLSIFGQTDIERIKGISISIFDENTSYPTWKMVRKPIHFGISASFDLKTKQKKIYNYTHIFQLGYYHHKDFHQALFLAWKPKFEWQFKNGLSVHGITGLGYLHSFPTEQTYALVDGEYKKKANFGRPHAIISFGLGLGYSFKNVPIDVFTRYEWFLIGPYAPKSAFPSSSNTAFSLGLRFYPFKTKTND